MKTYARRLCLFTFAALAAIAAAAIPSVARAADATWPQWRGPNFDGSSTAKDLPTTFSKTENLLWSSTLPGMSNGTPIVSGDRVYTTAVDKNSKKLLAVALNRADGKMVWQKEIGVGFKEKGENSLATPSPVTDGKSVYFMFGTGDLVAFDVEGKALWSRNLQKDFGAFSIMWIYGSSPLLYKGKLYVQVLQSEHPYGDTTFSGAAKIDGPTAAYLLAIDPATGKDLWKHVRQDEAHGESKESYATPVPHTTAAGREEILLVGGDCVTAHDPATGEEIWRFSGWNPSKINHWRMVPSVVAGGGFVFACAPKGGPVMAIKEDGQGDVSKTHLAWSSEGKKASSDVCVPLFYNGLLYVLDPDSKKLYQIDPKTGDIKWTTSLGGGAVFRGSPTGADGKIYCMNVNADVWVLSADEGKVLSKTSLDAPHGARGSVAVADGMVVLRAGDTLYAFGKK